MNVSLERGAYDLRDQSAKAEQLRELAQKYAQETRQLEAPEALADRAHKLGMVDAAPRRPVRAARRPDHRRGGEGDGTPLT